MTPDRRQKIEAEAREWLRSEAFRNGQGDQARRLVLTDDGPPKRDLGGWCVEALADKLADLLERLVDDAVAEERKALREIVSRARRGTVYIDSVVAVAILAALDAREAATAAGAPDAGSTPRTSPT